MQSFWDWATFGVAIVLGVIALYLLIDMLSNAGRGRVVLVRSLVPRLLIMTLFGLVSAWIVFNVLELF